MFSKKYPVWFRYGTFKFLQLLSQNGTNTIHLATHACPQYAERVAKYLRKRIDYLKLIVLSFQKVPLELKHVSFQYEFILEDNPQRWIAGTEKIICIPPFTDITVAHDFILMGYAAIVYNTNRLLPDDIIRLISEFVGGTVGFEMLRFCNRCIRWVLAQGTCDQCGLNEGSDTDINDSFEKDAKDST
jgi:hypothetical protein